MKQFCLKSKTWVTNLNVDEMNYDVYSIFWPLDYILLGSGCQLFQRTRLVRILNTLQIILLVMTQLHFFYSWSFLLKLNSELLSRLMIYVYFIFGHCFSSVFIRNKSRLRSLLISLISPLEEEKRGKLKRICFITALLSFLIFAYQSVLLLSIAFQEPNPEDPYQIGLFQILTYIWTLTNNWMIGGAGIYTFFVKSIQEYEESFFDRIENSLKLLTPGSVLLQRKKVNKKKECFLTLMSYLPCLWFVYLFISATGFIMSLTSEWNRNHLLVTILGFGPPMLLNIVMIVYLTLTASHCMDVIRNRLEELSEDIARRPDVIQWQIVLTQIEEDKRFEFTAWGFFDINKRLELSFLASLISFTALFTQMSSNLSN